MGSLRCSSLLGGLRQQTSPCQGKQHSTPLVLRSSAKQATFLSLEYVEELLGHARRVENERDLLDLPLPQSYESTEMLSCIVQESRFLECWPRLRSSIDEDQSSSSMSPSYLLRTGVLRALDFSMLNLTNLDNDMALVLGRDVVRPMQLLSGVAEEPLFYRVAAQEDLRQMALCEWCEGLLFFSLNRGFSALQTQCVLLSAMHLLAALAGMGAGAAASDSEVEELCTRVLGDLLVEQACILPRKTYAERVVVKEVVYEEKDAEFVAAIEAKLMKEKNKRQQQQLRDTLAKAPVIKRSRQETVREKVMVDVSVGPYFSLPEAARVLNYFSTTVVRHWRLFHFLLTESQPIDAEEITVEQCDSFPFCVPPLTEFLREDTHALEAERQAVFSECEVAINASFEEEFLLPVSELKQQCNEELRLIEEEMEQRERSNLENALTPGDYTRVVRGFALRLEKLAERNEAVGEIEISSVPEISVARSNGKKRSGNGKSSAAVATLHDSPTVAPAVTAFMISEVESRVEKIERAVEGLKEKPKKQRS
ncbi:hypothetical protein ERJ75_000133200 [Trypanosoma vivax]|uniref:Uncharacterized protein n=1 Tax=Trypanosoma vivax (strain Y486) TaxID=1055687 RepID=G0TT38_TRYVY|nr:hypothetical protein TRVL_02802 [Trypanosoma vivax]KAH8619755.1 hypothetical protein ERJ75_000133200 [Trypanosoma vivax]CCC47119.1 conserved hypothetical protein [Trypanosoma vivax Y486]